MTDNPTTADTRCTMPIDTMMQAAAIPHAGQFEIAPKIFWCFSHKPNWRTRFAARWLLGWAWTDG